MKKLIVLAAFIISSTACFGQTESLPVKELPRKKNLEVIALQPPITTQDSVPIQTLDRGTPRTDKPTVQSSKPPKKE